MEKEAKEAAPTEEQQPLELSPVEFILMNGIGALDDFTAKNPEVADPIERLKAFGAGVKSALNQTKMGLYALTPEEVKWLFTISKAKEEIHRTGQQDKLMIRLSIVEKPGEKVLLDAAGKPAMAKGGIITLK